jgi:hypothetical protein
LRFDLAVCGISGCHNPSTNKLKMFGAAIADIESRIPAGNQSWLATEETTSHCEPVGRSCGVTGDWAMRRPFAQIFGRREPEKVRVREMHGRRKSQMPQTRSL